MTIQEFYYLAMLAAAVLAAFWVMVKVAAGQFQRALDSRFASQEEARRENHTQITERLRGMDAASREDAQQWQRVERDLLRWQAEMPVQYVRRDDYIRGQSVLEAKIDGLGTKLENNRLRERINTP